MGKSQLFSIGKESFSYTSIKTIIIPPSVGQIGRNAFYMCQQLQKVELSEDSKLQLIDESTFSYSSIRKFFISPKISQICEKSFANCMKLRKVLSSENSELQLIDKDAFFESAIEYIMIPSKVNQIGRNAFMRCLNLKSIELLNDVLSIGNFCFYRCSQLFVVSFPNAEKVTIGEKTFFENSNLLTIFIPPKITIEQE